MSTRNDVLAEFTRGTVTRYFDTDAMADEIVRLRERVRELEVASAAGVTVTEAMVEAAWKELRVQCVPDGPSLVDCVDRDDLRSAITAALTRPTTPTRGSDE